MNIQTTSSDGDQNQLGSQYDDINENNINKYDGSLSGSPMMIGLPTSAINIEKTANSSLSKLDKSELLILEELNCNTKRTTTDEEAARVG